jgi:hypothetical protein
MGALIIPTTKTLIKNPCEFSLGMDKTKKPFGQMGGKRNEI